MPEREIMTQTIEAADAGRTFNQVLKQVSEHNTRIVVENNGFPVAAIISAEDLERFSRWESQRQANFGAITRLRQAFMDVPDEELAAEVDKAVAAAREELRAERASRRTE